MVQRAAAHGYGALVLTVDTPVSGLRLRELRGTVRLPRDLALPNLTSASTEGAREGGFMAVVTREFERALTPDDIGWLAGLTDLPVVVKGVQRGDDAVRCVDAGAAAIVVSNHGARQLADAPATADILAEIVDAVAGRAEVYVDGGVRRSPDVVKALALGARAVLVGRPALWALAAGGSEGVASLLRWYESELQRAMALCGAASVAQLDLTLVRRAPGWA
jgi:4-hydroxymandelate oxidase